LTAYLLAIILNVSSKNMAADYSLPDTGVSSTGGMSE
jgi:hypothetical protein